MSKEVISRIHKTKENVETELKPKKSTPNTYRKIIRYVKKNSFASARDTIRKLEFDISENTENTATFG